MSVEITIGRDWGCEHTDDDGEAYAAFAAAWLRRVCGIEAEVTYDPGYPGGTRVDNAGTMDPAELKTLVGVDAWGEFCETDWPSAAVAQ